MENLLGNYQQLFLLFKALIFLCCLVIVVIMVIYNLLYLTRILRSSHLLGLHSPKKLHYLIRISIFLPLLIAIIIIILLVTGWY